MIKAIRIIGAALAGGVCGALGVGAIAYLTCGTVSYLVEPNPEMIHPFFFPASLGGIGGVVVGFVLGATVGACRTAKDPAATHLDDAEGH